MARTGPRRSIGSAATGALALAAVSLLWGAPAAATPSVAIGSAALHSVHGAPRAHARLDRMALADREGDSLLTLALSAPVRLHLLRLHRPERIVIDLPHTQRLATLPLPLPSGAIAALRVGQLRTGVLRLVLQVDPAARWTARSQRFDHGRQWQVVVSAGASGALPVRSAPSDSPPSAGAPPATVLPPARSIAATHAPRGEHQVVVAIDAGHGGLDPGASGRDGTHEKDVTLAIARALAARVDHEPGMRAVLTRDGDYFIALPERLERARKAHADFFVSIHADSVRDPLISGASVYVLSERGASSEAARRLAEQENAADLRGGVSLAAQKANLRSVLLDVSQSEYIGQSAEAAEHVLSALAGVGAVRKREVQRAAFVVLKSPFIPSMLVETAYISNRSDEERLKSLVEQERLAAAIFQGITNYFRQYPPPGSLFAHARAPAAPASS
jgi:N-acetylmuramoyl-L-alanine amidase